MCRAGSPCVRQSEHQQGNTTQLPDAQGLGPRILTGAAHRLGNDTLRALSKALRPTVLGTQRRHLAASDGVRWVGLVEVRLTPAARWRCALRRENEIRDVAQVDGVATLYDDAL